MKIRVIVKHVNDNNHDDSNPWKILSYQHLHQSIWETPDLPLAPLSNPKRPNQHMLAMLWDSQQQQGLLRWAKNPCKRWKIYIYLVKEPCVSFLGMHMTPNTLFWGILCPSPNVGKLGKSSSQLPLVGDMFVSPGPGRLSQWWRVFPGWRPFEVSMLAWATLTRILWSDLNRQRWPGFWLFYRLGELWLYYPVTERSK